ncbi:MAG: hypothetical protein GY941_04500 [Planctomycetes bacterium]|nr:hypothetical protein [Planctomycetota bacterium]
MPKRKPKSKPKPKQKDSPKNQPELSSIHRIRRQRSSKLSLQPKSPQRQPQTTSTTTTTTTTTPSQPTQTRTKRGTKTKKPVSDSPGFNSTSTSAATTTTTNDEIIRRPKRVATNNKYKREEKGEEKEKEKHGASFQEKETQSLKELDEMIADVTRQISMVIEGQVLSPSLVCCLSMCPKKRGEAHLSLAAKEAHNRNVRFLSRIETHPALQEHLKSLNSEMQAKIAHIHEEKERMRNVFAKRWEYKSQRISNEWQQEIFNHKNETIACHQENLELALVRCSVCPPPPLGISFFFSFRVCTFH